MNDRNHFRNSQELTAAGRKDVTMIARVTELSVMSSIAIRAMSSISTIMTLT